MLSILSEPMFLFPKSPLVPKVGKAFLAASVIVFGGAALTFELATSKLELLNSDDIRTKGQTFVRPWFEMFREKLTPIRTWAEDTSKKWHFEKDENFKEKPLIKELSKAFGTKAN